METSGSLDDHQKAIEKEPTRGCRSPPMKWQNDLERFIQNRPIKARRISPWPGPCRRGLMQSSRRRFCCSASHWVWLPCRLFPWWRPTGTSGKRSPNVNAPIPRRPCAENEIRSRKLAEKTCGTISSVLMGKPGMKTGKTIAVYTVLKNGLKNIPTRLRRRQTDASRLLQAIGTSFESLSEYPEAINTDRIGHVASEELLEESDRRTMNTMTSLVDVYVSNQQGKEAIELAERAWKLTLANHTKDKEYCLLSKTTSAPHIRPTGRTPKLLRSSNLS